MKLKISKDLKKIKAVFLLTTLCAESDVFSLDMMAYNYDSHRHVNSSQKYTIPNSTHPDVSKLFDIGAKLTNGTIASASDRAEKFARKSAILGARCNKLFAGYSTYSIGAILKGSSYIAGLSSTTLVHAGKIFQVAGNLDEIGQNISGMGHNLTNYGANLLEANHNAQKTKPSTYVTNLLYGAKETFGITSVLGGGLTQGFGVCARILGLTSKGAANVTTNYISPSLAVLGRNANVAGNACSDYSKIIFESL